MSKEPVSIILGDEYDDDLRDALRSVLMANDAIGVDGVWGVGGSQELEIVRVKLGEDLITIESETFVGLTIEGPKSVVDDLVRKVRQHMKEQ